MRLNACLKHPWIDPIMPLVLIQLTMFIGCSQTQKCVEPDRDSYSELAGRWGWSMRDGTSTLFRGSEVPSSYQDVADQDMLVVSFEPDGSLDWPRTEFGVIGGWQNLSNPGDESYDIADPTHRFRVVSSEYTPTHSRIEIESWRLDTTDFITLDPWDLIRFEAKLDGRLLAYTVAMRKDVDRWENVKFLLRRFQGSRRAHTCNELGRPSASKLSGNWGQDDEILLMLSEDGTFDWTGTIEGKWERWFQLEQDGDECFHGMDPTIRYEVVSAKYTPVTSLLWVRVVDKNASNGGTKREIILRAELQDADHLSLSIIRLFNTNDSDSQTFLLHRIAAEPRRVESITRGPY